MTARIVAFAIDSRLAEFEQICFDLPVVAREAALDLWKEFAPRTRTITVTPRRSILKAPALASATYYRIAN
ncbi:MAG: hypothetical protein Q8P56_06735 [Candidatus Uhrbacteria bacterium]|nr:hypothetical protein [Candidatus Uhrbacteria bacterium]